MDDNFIGKDQTPLSSMRFQSQLGNEYVRNYKTGKDIDKIMLARVVKVNYKYNTVDVITTTTKDSFLKNPNNNGRYSARLPISFGGKTPDGKTYGSNTLVTKGSLVLVGFLEGNKDQPIVLNIYGDADNQSQLTRTEFSSADESDETVQRELWQLFTLYPSMTYKNIDGRGNEEVTFSGRTFKYITETDPENDYVNDTAFDYDHLPNSRYANGEQIEPVSPEAPTILYVHQGVYDDHRVTFFIKSDGTVRVGSRHVDGEGITFQEMKRDGTFSIIQKKDTVDPEEDTQRFSRMEINENGHVILKSRRHNLEITDNGVYVDGKPIGMAMSEELDRLEQGIIDANASIGIIDGKIELKANQTSIDYINEVIKEQEASITVAFDEINSKVSRREFDAIALGTNNMLTNTHFKTEPSVHGESVHLELIKQEGIVNSAKLTRSGSTDKFGIFVGELDPVELKEGEHYTLSFKGKLRDIEEINNIYLTRSGQFTYKLPNITVKEYSGEFEDYNLTFNLDEDLEGGVYVYIGVDAPEDNINTIEIKEIQLEKGTEVTEWNLHYLDFSISNIYETEIKQLAEEISITAKSAQRGINELGERVDDHTTRIEEAEFKITPSEITSVVRRSQAYTQDLEDARQYARELSSSIETELGTVENNLTNLGDYLDGAFKDGVVSESEVQAIETHIKVLSSERDGLDSKYFEVLEAPEVRDEVIEDDLKEAKKNFDNAHDNLVDKIQDAIEDRKITAEEKEDIDSRFSAYRYAVSQLHKVLEKAVNFIADAKAKAAENNANAYTDGKIHNVQSEIEQLADSIALRVTEEELFQSLKQAEQSAKDYAKDLNDKALNDIEGVNSSLGDLGEYLDGAFKDGVIDNAEIVSIEKLVRTLNVEKSEVDARYREISNSRYLTSKAKNDLQDAKLDYNSTHDSLINTIEDLMDRGNVSDVDKKDLDTRFMYYEDALSELATQFERATDDISEEKMKKAEQNSIEYVDGVAHVIDERLKTAEQKITSDAIISTVTESTKYQTDFSNLQSNIDNMEIGGTNFAQSSLPNDDGLWYFTQRNTESNTGKIVDGKYFEIINTENAWKQWQISNTRDGALDKIEEGIYTLSLEMRKSKSSDDGRVRAQVRYTVNGSSNNVVNIEKNLSELSTKWKKFSATDFIEDDVIKEASQVRIILYYVGSGTVQFRKVKLEKGNKATDWSPAPEDLATSEGLQGLESRLKTAEQKITPDSIISTVTSSSVYREDFSTIQSNIDNMEIGGRNLLGNSKKPRLSTNSSATYPLKITEFDDYYRYEPQEGTGLSTYSSLNDSTYPIYDKDWLGKDMYVSMAVRVSKDIGLRLRFSDWGRNSKTIKEGHFNVKASDGWVRIGFHVPSELIDKNPNDDAIRFLLYTVNSDNSSVKTYDGYIDSKDWKIVFGTKDDGWSPAPEDVDGKIGAVGTIANNTYNELQGQIARTQTTFEQHANMISSKVEQTDFTGNKLVSMIEQTASSITLSANKINFDGHVFGRDATFAGNVEARNIVVNEGDIRVFTSGTNEEYTLIPHTNMVSDAGFEGLPLHDIPHNTSHLDKEPLFYHTDRTGYLGGDLSWGEEGKPSIHKGDTYSDSVAIFGSRSAVVNNTNYFFQRPTFKGGTRYTLSAYFSSSGHRNGDGYPMMTLYVKQGEVSSTAPTIERRDYKSTRKVTNKPVRHTFTFTTPNLKINKKDYYAGIDIKSTDSKYVMADGIQLVEGEVAAAYQDDEELWDFLRGNTDGYHLKSRLGNIGELHTNYTESNHTSTDKITSKSNNNTRLEIVGGKGTMTFYANGAVHHKKGTSSDSFWRVSSAGNATFDGWVAGTKFNSSSTADIKRDIRPWEGRALDLINGSTVYDYLLKNDIKELGEYARRQQGLVIGEGYSINPDIIEDGDEGNHTSVNLYKMVAWSWKGIQELYDDLEPIKTITTKVDDNRRMIDELEMENMQLKSRVVELERRINVT